MTPRIGSMCTGYGGLDVAVQAVIGGEHAWMAENDPHASKVLAHHWPNVPNLGDITTIDWSTVEPVDIIAAGFPCTNISNAGKQEGIHGKQSGIWKNVAEGVRVLRPGLVVLENVAAIRTRGLDVVTADLAAIGYDAIWTSVRASDLVGAPHARDRWFCLAYPAVPHAERGGRDRRPWDLAEAQGRHEPADRGNQAAGVALLPTPTAADGDRTSATYARGNPTLVGIVADLLPTPTVTNSHGNHRNSRGELLLPGIVLDLLPTPCDADGTRATRGGDRSDELLLAGIAREATGGPGVEWGKYEPAVRRWESVTGRSAPCPTESAPKGGRRLAPAFPEWMMGLPPGHVTGVTGLSRNAQLRVIGGGVVPRHGIAAIESLLAHLKEAAA